MTDYAPLFDGKTISQKQIDQDHADVEAWMARNSVTKIDGHGTWRKDGKQIKKREMPDIDYDWNAKWGKGKKP
jgi:hypothetical protein